VNGVKGMEKKDKAERKTGLGRVRLREDLGGCCGESRER
jgi:hypothetical protein